MKQITIILLSLIILSCSNNDENIADSNILSNYLYGKSIETGAVIACAANQENTNKILAFYYPKTGAINISYYETQTAQVNKLDYSKYKKIALESEPFFNGYLGKFTRAIEAENWIIITYELNNEVKISNPIRTKHLQKPSVWNTNVTINLNEVLMPQFSWEANAVGNNSIYFQVVSNANNDLVSGTYTNESTFKFYDTSNVVLNITNGFPELESNANYNFTLMDVSLDNWVNLVSEKEFNTQ